jgi:hypothetical protein
MFYTGGTTRRKAARPYIRGSAPLISSTKTGSRMSAGLRSASAYGIPELAVEPAQQAALLNLKAKAKRRAIRRK